MSQNLGFLQFLETFGHRDELPSNFELTLAYLKKFGAQTFKILHCFEIWGGVVGKTGERKIKIAKCEYFRLSGIFMGFTIFTWFATRQT